MKMLIGLLISVIALLAACSEKQSDRAERCERAASFAFGHYLTKEEQETVEEYHINLRP